MEISHRSPEFLEIKNNCENLFRELLEIPNDYSILWTHGCGHGQFSAVPLNLSKDTNNSPNYFVKGPDQIDHILNLINFIILIKFVNVMKLQKLMILI